jgi:hypothetical protein
MRHPRTTRAERLAKHLKMLANESLSYSVPTPMK